jgi:hypothetical protein
MSGDWWTDDALAMPVRPAAESTVLQNPPLFSWPTKESVSNYEFQLWSDKNGWLTHRVNKNWLHLDSALGRGVYRWRVRPASSDAQAAWSTERSFKIDSTSETYVVALPSTLVDNAIRNQRPRGFPRGEELASLKKALAGTRSTDTAQLKLKVQKSLGNALPVEPTQRFDKLPTSAATNQAIGDIRNRLHEEQELVLSLGLLWLVEGNPKWRDAAMLRVQNLAAWDPSGSTGRVSHTQATRTILLILAVGFDWFYDQWTPAQRAMILHSASKRYADLYDVIVANGSLASKPLNSFNSYTLGYLVATAPLLAKDIPEASKWFGDAFPLYAAIFPAWSGDDGGYGNGTAYGVWDVPESIVLYDLLRWGTGFDIYKKPAIRNFGKLMAYFLPPGAPEGVFGDGAEVRMASSIARYGKAFAARAPSPLLDWYSKQLFGEDRTSFAMLTSPTISTDVSRTSSPEFANSILFPSVGWSAMHSSLSDRGRVSVYFKSSPLGSFNHSHADQNSFVIHAHGRVLAMDSGYYDYYNSPHWRDWYKQTRAHNAITYDGGQGQSLGDTGMGTKSKAGRITRFVQGNNYDLVTGDAASAFGIPLSTAKRTLIFFKPTTVVVVDEISGPSPRLWEWNLHTPASLVKFEAGYKLAIDDAEMCVNISSPESLSLRAEAGYNPKPEMAGNVLPHVWNRFVYQEPSANALFVAVLRMDCTVVAPKVSFVGKTAEINVGGNVVSFSAGNVTVR